MFTLFILFCLIPTDQGNAVKQKKIQIQIQISVNEWGTVFDKASYGMADVNL